MTADEQEALSIALARGWWCVPLSSGRIAVMPHPMRTRELRIVDDWEQVKNLPRSEPVRVEAVASIPTLTLNLGGL